MAAMILVSATGLLPPATAIPMTAMAAVLTGCIGIRAAYEKIDLQSLVIVGAMIPFGEALQKTGAASGFADWFVGMMVGAPPQLLFAAVLALTVALTQVVENAAAATLIGPLAYAVAVRADCRPEPFVLGVAICISAAFVTPIAHESTILVMGPGKYRFRDYVRLGLPFAVITWLLTSWLLPLQLPLQGR